VPPSRTPDHLQLKTRREVGARIRQLRRAHGWSQETLAEQAGVDRRTIGSWELGLTAPTLDDLVALARALGTQTIYLFWT
jgi:transcriptional regulator with XRE-family HTH domain